MMLKTLKYFGVSIFVMHYASVQATEPTTCPTPEIQNGNLDGIIQNALSSAFFNKEEVFALTDQAGNIPEIILLNGTKTAYLLTKTMKMKETDPARAAQIPVEDKIRMQFAGISLRPDGADSKQLRLQLIGRTQEIELPQTISRQALERGEIIEIKFPEETRSLLGQTVSGHAEMKIKFDPSSQALQVIEARGVMKVDTLIGTTEDSGELKNLTGKISTTVERKPLRSAS